MFFQCHNCYFSAILRFTIRSKYFGKPGVYVYHEVDNCNVNSFTFSLKFKLIGMMCFRGMIGPSRNPCPKT